MAPALVPDPHAFFYRFYFTSHTVGECITSFHVFSFYRHSVLYKIPPFFNLAQIAGLLCLSTHKDKGKLYVCVSYVCAHVSMCAC